MKRIGIAVLIAMLSGLPALAACPSIVPGTEAEAIAANNARLVCLQQEIAAEARMRNMELEIQQLQMRQQHLELQRRLDAIPKPPQVVIPEIKVPH